MGIGPDGDAFIAQPCDTREEAIEEHARRTSRLGVLGFTYWIDGPDPEPVETPAGLPGVRVTIMTRNGLVMVPECILRAAESVEDWMASKGLTHWQLGGICARATAAAARESVDTGWVAEMMNRRAAVEIELFECASGKRTLPDAKRCRELAVKLGKPSA
jgi:hypothetical protein